MEWINSTSLHLHRLGHEETGLLEWENCTGEVPTTDPKICLPGLDITDPEHPIYAKPVSDPTLGQPGKVETDNEPEPTIGSEPDPAVDPSELHTSDSSTIDENAGSQQGDSDGERPPGLANQELPNDDDELHSESCPLPINVQQDRPNDDDELNSGSYPPPNNVQQA